MCLLRTALLGLLSSLIASGQSYTISTIAGGAPMQFNVLGTSASIAPDNVAIDAAGNLFLADQSIVLRLDAKSGLLTLVAGTGITGYNGDNIPAASAELFNVKGIAVDSAGNLYIADASNQRIREVSNGIITTIAGNGTAGFSGDKGPATNAQLAGPNALALDAAGNVYFVDFNNNRVREVSKGLITTVAGNGTQGFSGDNGPATGAQLRNPFGLALDSSGNLFIADYGNSRIRKVANGVITTFAGTAMAGFGGDNGPATSAELFGPVGVALDSAGNLYIADFANFRIRKVSNGTITTVAGNGTQGFSGDSGPATSAELNLPEGLASDSAGNLYIADSDNLRIRKVSNGVITTVAGNGAAGAFSGDSGPATSAQLYQPQDIAIDSAGNLYIADTGNSRIRRVSNGVFQPSPETVWQPSEATMARPSRRR